MNNYIYITLQEENFHKWKDAPDTEAYLRDKHRHIFYFKVYIGVLHNDREIEFFDFKRYVQIFTGNHFLWENMSCEMIAEKVIEHIKMKYADRTIIVDVSEDNENGAMISGKI